MSEKKTVEEITKEAPEKADEPKGGFLRKKVSDKDDSKKKKKKSVNESDEGLTEEEKKLREEQRKRAARKKRKKLIKTLIIFLIIFAIIGFAAWRFIDLKKREKAESTLVTYTVERRTITKKLSATGTLYPSDSYTVTSKVRGDIIECFFEEGDEVQKDDVLYVVDSEDMDSTIRQRELSLEKAQKNLDDLLKKRNELSATSDLEGTVVKLYVEEGDTVQKGGTVADIVDNKHMLVDIPFHASHADMMGIGADVTVVIEGTGERIAGVVTDISVITGTNAFNAPTKDVTIKVENPGGLSKNTRALGEWGTDVVSTDLGTFYYNVEEQLKAEYGGEIISLSVKEGDRVYEGQTIMRFDSEDLEDQIKDATDNLETAQMNYDDTLESMDDYEIKAPITGTVVEKNFNVGESIDTTGGNATVAIIYDLSALTFDMSIDELDIFSVQKGQEVIVTSEAVSDIFYGEITKISKVGSTSSGTTVYPVTVTITDEAALQKLLPGMNIDAEITIEKAENVLAVPSGAVARGNTVKVVKDPEALKEWQAAQVKDNASKNGSDSARGQQGGNASYGKNSQYGANGGYGAQTAPAGNGGSKPADGTMPEMPTDGTMPQMPADGTMPEMPADGTMPQIPADGTMPEMPTDGTMPQKPADGTMPQMPQMSAMAGMMQRPATYGSAPAETEYETVKVEIGISDDDFVEIISGLEEGDIVIIEQNQASGGYGFGGMGMGMGMPGGMGMGGMGGMPAGGMGGNRPSGVMGGSRPSGGMGR